MAFVENEWGPIQLLGVGVCLSRLLSTGSGRTQATTDKGWAVTSFSLLSLPRDSSPRRGALREARDGSFVKQVEFVHLTNTASASIPSFKCNQKQPLDLDPKP